jgi:hypothetical protein
MVLAVFDAFADIVRNGYLTRGKNDDGGVVPEA